MKKTMAIFGALCLLSLSVAANSQEEKIESEQVFEEDFFCDAGWNDVEEYWDSGGEDGFYAGYLFCYHCRC